MEIHPVLEGDVNPADNMWYVVSALGDRPSLRVGHTAVHHTGADGVTSQVFTVGGANPSETFLDIHILDLSNLSWNMNTSEGFEARYEHVSFIPSSQPNKIYVLSGANQEGNLSSIQHYDINSTEWNTIKVTGSVPAPRTHHTTAANGDCVYLFSGGKSGAEPVQDRQLHCFNAQTNAWTSPPVSGELPAPRHGHSLCVFGSKLICFGGMAGTKFYNDVHVLDLEKGQWSTVKMKKRNQPDPRASHAAIIHKKSMYVFGGLNKDGMALDDLWKLDLSTMQWNVVTIEGPPPASRLDMACCLVKWRWSSPSEVAEEVMTGVNGDRAEEAKPSEKAVACCAGDNENSENACTMLLIHGGMDTQGEIFDDCLVFRLAD